MGELPDARPGADDLSGIVRGTPGAVTSLDLEGLVLGGALAGVKPASWISVTTSSTVTLLMKLAAAWTFSVAPGSWSASV